jgi:crossover junction endodeoxyribonuclease RuvC
VKDTVRILGIDPGSRLTGFGIVDMQGNRIELVDCGAIATEGDHADRLRIIFAELRRLVAEHAPHEVAIERVFVHRNADSALKLGQARAAALCATFDADLPVYEYAARHIKKAVVGRGAAEKDQVQQMVRLLLGMRAVPQADAADALAAALCHAHEREARQLIRAVAVRT